MKTRTFAEAFEYQMAGRLEESKKLMLSRRCGISGQAFESGDVPLLVIVPVSKSGRTVVCDLVLAKKEVLEDKKWEYYPDPSQGIPQVTEASAGV